MANLCINSNFFLLLLDNRTSYYGSKVEECLRSSFKKGDIEDGESCSQAIASLIEATNIDIRADALLYK